jgi:hypothetical protein
MLQVGVGRQRFAHSKATLEALACTGIGKRKMLQDLRDAPFALAMTDQVLESDAARSGANSVSQFM